MNNSEQSNATSACSSPPIKRFASTLREKKFKTANAQDVVDVAEHCTRHMLATEAILHCGAGKINQAVQSEITERHRSILVSWLVEVHTKYEMKPETLYITVNLIDRYCESRNITRAQY